MTDPFSTSSIPVCLSLKEGKNQQTQGVYLKVQDLGDSLHHLILIVGVILTPRAGMVCSQVQSGGNENEHLLTWRHLRVFFIRVATAEPAPLCCLRFRVECESEAVVIRSKGSEP